MPVLSYLHHLFNVDQCHAYIHTLRWKERPLQCPRCQSQAVDPWGNYHYRPGCKRSWCHGCKRTFNDLTDTLLHQSKRSLPYWILATFLLCLSCSSRRIARELGVHSRTSYRWCWWLRNTAVSYETDRRLEGTVEADDLYHTAGQKGQAKHGGAKPLGRRIRKIKGLLVLPRPHLSSAPGAGEAVPAEEGERRRDALGDSRLGKSMATPEGTCAAVCATPSRH